MPKYKVVPWFGESRSLFYVVDLDAKDPPEVIATFESRSEADKLVSEAEGHKPSS